MRYLLIITFYLIPATVFGQEANEVHQYFDFKDGIYLSHESLLSNTPDIKVMSEEGKVYNNPLKILRVNPSDFGLEKGQQIAFVVDQGLPYARVTRCCPDQVVYVGLTIVGRLSVVSFDSEEMVDVQMTAYNPYNNKPFLRGKVKREKKIKKNSVIDMETGKQYALSSTELQVLIGKQKTFEDLDDLIESVSTYNKTNKIYITK